jgi:hypothetical protein
MAKSKSGGVEARPSDEEISPRAYELYLQRGSVPGHENDDWLQAEAELIEARRNAVAAFAPDGVGQAASAGDESASGDGRKTNGRRESSTGGRRPLRQ